MSRRRGWLVLGALAVALVAAMLLPVQAAEKQLTVYSPAGSFTLAVLERDGTEYVDLIAVLETVGQPQVRRESRTWRVRMQNGEAQFSVNRTTLRLRGRPAELPAPFLVEAGQGLVPLGSLALLVSQLAGSPIDFHQTVRRLYLGVPATSFTTEMKSGPPATLVLDFSAPVSPAIRNEPGRMRLVFRSDPVQAEFRQRSFQDRHITGITYNEGNGEAELLIAAGAPLMASFQNGNRTIVISAAPSPERAEPAPPPPPPAEPAATAAPAAAVSAAAAPERRAGVPAAPQPVVVIDAAHGGNEHGVAFSEAMLEKDLTLALARRLRDELRSRGIPVLLLRDGDTELSTEQRAIAVNAVPAIAYVSLHAGHVGAGVRIYRAAPLPEDGGRGGFLPWGRAQAHFAVQSSDLAAAVAEEFVRHRVPTAKMLAVMAPLAEVAAPAVAVELAPPSGSAEELASADYQQVVAQALAEAIAGFRRREAP